MESEIIGHEERRLQSILRIWFLQFRTFTGVMNDVKAPQ